MNGAPGPRRPRDEHATGESGSYPHLQSGRTADGSRWRRSRLRLVDDVYLHRRAVELHIDLLRHARATVGSKTGDDPLHGAAALRIRQLAFDLGTLVKVGA